MSSPLATQAATYRDALTPYDGSTGMTCLYYNLGGSVLWKNKGGDYDPQVVASLPFTKQTSGTVVLDVTGAQGADGIVLKADRAIKFYSREGGKAPRLRVNGVEIPVVADTEISCSTSSSIGTRTTLSTSGNIILGFEKPLPLSGKIELLLDVNYTYSYAGTLTAHRLKIPRPEDGPVQLGFANNYIDDTGIENHPDVIAVVDPDDPDWWKGGTNVKEPLSDGCRVVDETQAKNAGFEPFSNKAIQSVAWANVYGSGCSNRYKRMPPLEEVYFRYTMRLGNDFWGSKDGGKMPGLTFYQSPSLCGNGGMSCAGGTKGWSLRGGFKASYDENNPMFPRVEMHTYAYHADQAGEYGDKWPWGPRGLLELERWYNIEQYVKVNDPGVRNGIMRVWVDGQLAFEKTGIMLRGPKPWDPDVIDDMLINVTPWLIHFYGGKYPQYVRDHTVWFDNIVVAKNYIGPVKQGDGQAPAPTPAPTVSFSVDPVTIESGQPTTLSWSSTNATRCVAEGGWSGNKTINGTESISPTQDANYVITCTGDGGTATANVTVTVATPSVVEPDPAPVPDSSFSVGWNTLPGTELRAVCPPKDFNGYGYDFQYRCDNVTSAWNSAAYDTLRNRLYITGGGHENYLGNEVYALDLAPVVAKTGPAIMVRLTDPAKPAASGTKPQELAPNDGTQPNARHTYDGLEYLQGIDKMWMWGGSPAVLGGCGILGHWYFDPVTNFWKRVESRFSGRMPDSSGCGSVSAFDPVSKKLFVFSNSSTTFGLYSLDPSNNTWQKLLVDSRPPIHANAVIHPEKRVMFIGGGKGNLKRTYNIDGPTYARTDLSLSGDCSVFDGINAPGMAYDPVSKRILAWAGGEKMTWVDLDQNSCTTEQVSGGPESLKNGTYGRLTYVQPLDVFVTCNSVDKPCMAFRPQRSESTRTTYSVSSEPQAVEEEEESIVDKVIDFIVSPFVSDEPEEEEVVEEATPVTYDEALAEAAEEEEVVTTDNEVEQNTQGQPGETVATESGEESTAAEEEVTVDESTDEDVNEKSTAQENAKKEDAANQKKEEGLWNKVKEAIPFVSSKKESTSSVDSVTTAPKSSDPKVKEKKEKEKAKKKKEKENNEKKYKDDKQAPWIDVYGLYRGMELRPNGQVSINASDDEKLDNVRVIVDGRVEHKATDKRTVYTLNSSLRNGSHLILITAKDKRGNRKTVTLTTVNNRVTSVQYVSDLK